MGGLREMESGEDISKRRFFQTAEEMRIIFIPQCALCEKNIDFVQCEAFAVKPRSYMENDEDCPDYVAKGE